MEDWTDMDHARRWSADPVTHNPTRPEQLDITLSVLEAEYRPGTHVLDVGMGSGIVEEMMFQRVPGVQIVGLDASDAMVQLAHERLAPYRGRYDIVMGDLTRLGAVTLPEHEYSVAVSVQVIHNVAHEHKREAFRFVREALAPGGLFLLLDRVRVDTPGLFGAYLAMWRRLDRLHGARVTANERETFEEHTLSVSTRGDQPATLEEHLHWLREAGFAEAACLHLHTNRALFAARKG
ncbi:MAG TPA: class I SAM-dependent methyltransferase [Chloroflexia bacterium]|nr:class I SAM-dependent methyltransferase [Chloroflexia bacterium]